MQSRQIRLLGTVLVFGLLVVATLLSARNSVGTCPPAPTTRATIASAVAVGSPVISATQASRPPEPTIAATPTTRRSEPTATAAPAQGARPTLPPTPRPQAAGPTADDGLPTIDFARLPPEARETIGLIERGGPFPYDRDGVTFGNRERLLPLRANGYYREYTVSTPGSPDRGARRIVAGQGGELYYTDDHYESFRRVRR